MSAGIGRNDPCHCGSGKKYKRCHLAEDERSRVESNRADLCWEPEDRSLVLPDSVQGIRDLISQLADKVAVRDDPKFQRLMARTTPVFACFERREEIHQAGQELEKHRAEFEVFAQDNERTLHQTEALFDEERFAPLWFTTADIEKAFEKVGYPGPLDEDQDIEILRAAILFVADKDRRTELSLQLLALLPEFVAAGRFIDGFIIELSSWQTAELVGESNLFLFQMFSHGYDAWLKEQRARDEAVLGEFGLDPARLQSMSLQEISAWFETQHADPAKMARLEALLTPDRKARAVVEYERMERNYIDVLNREDARALLLGWEEMEPWLPTVLEGWAKIQAKYPEFTSISEKPGPDSPVLPALGELIRGVAADMSATIFTTERTQKLLAQLRGYADEQFSAGDKRAATCVMGVINLLEHETRLETNHFLESLCFCSIRTIRPPSETQVPEEILVPAQTI